MVNENRSQSNSVVVSGDPDTAEYREAALHDAVNGLRERHPISSASVAFYPWQRNTLLAGFALVVVSLVFFLVPTLIALTLICTIGYIWAMVDPSDLVHEGSRCVLDHDDQ